MSTKTKREVDTEDPDLKKPPRPMLLEDKGEPRSWRMNARTKHLEDGVVLHANTTCKETEIYPCNCFRCIQDEYRDVPLVFGLPIAVHEDYDLDKLFDNGYVGIYVMDEMIGMEIMEGYCELCGPECPCLCAYSEKLQGWFREVVDG